MQIKIDTNGIFFENTYLLIKGRDLVIVDPGSNINLAEVNKYNLKAILITHAHIDHIDGLKYFTKGKIPLYISKLDEAKLTNPSSSLYQMTGTKISFKPSDFEIRNVTDKMKFTLLDEEFMVLTTPGHTNGSVCYLVKNILFSGDTLFKNSIGRTDFETGSMTDMKQSLNKLANLANEIKVYPGHDEITSIKEEKKNNPYLKKS